MYCNECGRRLEPNIKFCDQCGAPVKNRPPPKPRIVIPSNNEKTREDRDDIHDEEATDEPKNASPGTREFRGGNERSNRRSRRHGPGYRCPICNNELDYVDRYQKYYCTMCRKYPYDDPMYQAPQTMQPPSGNVRSLYASIFIVSLIGGILLITTEFSGGYSYHSGSYVRSETTISIGPWGLLFLVFFGVAMLLFIGTIISIRGLSPSKQPSRNQVKLGLVCALIVLIITILGGISSFIFMDTNNIWLSEGFYGGSIGSLLTTILFWMVLRNMPIVQPQYQTETSSRYYQDRS